MIANTLFAMTTPEMIFWFVELVLIAFWVWMLMDVIRSTTLTKIARWRWIIGFIFFGALAAIAYFFIRYTREGGDNDTDSHAAGDES